MPEIGSSTPIALTASSTGLEVRSGGLIDVKSSGVVRFRAGSQLDIGTATGLLVLAAGAIKEADIDTGAVTSGKIGAGAVDATGLKDAAVTSGKVAAGAVDATGLAAAAVTSGKIAGGAVDSSALSANLRLGYIDLPLTQARINSTIEGQSVSPASGTTPSLLKVSTAVAKMNQTLSWAAGSSGASAAVVWQVAVPPDFNSATSFSVRFWGDKSSGNEDVDPVIGVRNGGTATAQIGGSATTNFTTLQAEQVRVVASGLVSYPGTLNISFHTETQASAVVRLHGGHVLYQRKS